MKKTVALLVLASFMCGHLISCGNDTDTEIISTDETTAIQEDDSINELSSLSGLDFNGATINILCRQDESNTAYINEFDAEDDGDVVHAEIFKRNRTIEELLNVEIVPISVDGFWSNRNNFMAMVQNSVMSGASEYDIVTGYMAYASTMATSGLLSNLIGLPYLDFTQSWWNSSAIKDNTIDDKLFFAYGDVGLSGTRSLFNIYFNKKLAEDLKIDNLYQTVLDGKWTIDKAEEYIKSAAKDLNGDSEFDYDNDQWGYICNQAAEMPAAFNINWCSIENKLPVLNMNTEKTVEALARVNKFFYETEGVAPLDTSSTDHTISLNAFVEGRALFFNAFLGRMDQMRSMSDDFGVLPLFKWDEEQEFYNTCNQDGVSGFCIPIDCADLDAVSATLEAFAIIGNKEILPAYYEKAMIGKYVRDKESIEMIELIREHVSFSFGVTYGAQLNYISDVFQQLVKQRTTDFSSFYASNEAAYQGMLATLVETIQNYDK